MTRMAEVARLPHAPTPEETRQENLGFMRRDEIQALLDEWQPPKISDERLELEAALFLRWPWRTVVPFAAYLSARGVK